MNTVEVDISKCFFLVALIDCIYGVLSVVHIDFLRVELL